MSVPVSVVMGVYNDAAHVAAAVESIRAQTFGDWEFIIVDDGSTDETGAILRDLLQRDPRIHVISQENAGLTQALIRGCAAAQGEFIARQDADDVSSPERFAKQMALLRSNPQLGLVSSGALHVAPHGEPLEIVTGPNDPAEATRRLVAERQGPSAHGSVMFRRELYEAVGGYRAPFHFAQDIDLWLRMTERAPLGYVSECLYQWRRCDSGISGARHAAQREFGDLAFACRAARDRGESEATLLDRAAELTNTLRHERDARRSETTESLDTTYIIGTQLARNGDRRATGYLWNVVRRRPWHWKAWIRLLQTGVTARRGNGLRLSDAGIPSVKR